jgi:hypothetical protein
MEKYRPQPEQQQPSPEGGQRFRGFQDRQPEQTQPVQGRAEGRESLQFPTTVDQSGQLQPQPENQERRPLPNVWNVLERDVRFGERYDSDFPTSQEYEEGERELGEVNRLKGELYEKGSPRDKLLLDLYSTVTLEPSGLPVLIPYNRSLSRGEYEQFRFHVEGLSEEQLAEEIRKAKEDFKRREEAHPGQRWPDDPGIIV